MLLQNGGVLPLTFCLDHVSNPALTELVSIIPKCGFIQPGHHQILTLRTIPTEDGPKEGFTSQLLLNATKHTKVPFTCYTSTQGKHTTTILLTGFSTSLGIDSCQCGRKAMCVSGRRQQFIFLSNSCGITNSALQTHQESQSSTSPVGWLICFLSVVILTFFSVMFAVWIFLCIISCLFSWLSVIVLHDTVGSSGTFQRQTRGLSLLNQMLVNCIPMRAQ